MSFPCCLPYSFLIWMILSNCWKMAGIHWGVRPLLSRSCSKSTGEVLLLFLKYLLPDLLFGIPLIIILRHLLSYSLFFGQSFLSQLNLNFFHFQVQSDRTLGLALLLSVHTKKPSYSSHLWISNDILFSFILAFVNSFHIFHNFRLYVSHFTLVFLHFGKHLILRNRTFSSTRKKLYFLFNVYFAAFERSSHIIF